MSEWQPIETAPKDGNWITGKESYVPKWPDSGRTRYRIFKTQWVTGEGWTTYNAKGEGTVWVPDRWRPRK